MFAKLRQSRLSLAACGFIAALVVCLVFLYPDVALYRPPTRALRIGIWNGPPFEIVNPDGSVTGLGPDVINAAANRLGIRLEWVSPKEGPEQLLPAGKVDLWGVLSMTPSRKQNLSLTRPWAETNYALVSLDVIEHQSDILGVVDAPVPLHIARTARPTALIKRYPNRNRLFDGLCAGEINRIVMDQRSLVAQSMMRTPACAGASFSATLLPAIHGSKSLPRPPRGNAFMPKRSATRSIVWLRTEPSIRLPRVIPWALAAQTGFFN